ncbi:hypothetical protein Ade02nite_09720 [Paractinoplanes deccanensis]|uniref:Uncharacterized protein n=1 Tax=Paractinoplanes deccanensis TaxID=113561 RepID=A0ABQ3XX57_9ACTN|nr:hypothetical protein [Actinoplanes deccanensis]GID72331.1 hypothetical protein Ade02nite_09720 [Actinoplanes deccanensis]
MRLSVRGTSSLVFDDGSPVRAASAIAPFGDGHLIAQDDATHAAWCRPGSTVPVRVLDPVDGLEVFSSVAGTKHLKPDFEAACPVGEGVLLLGSGSTPARMRASLVTAEGFTPVDLTVVYHRVAAALGVPVESLNLEGACAVGDRLRWFQRGNAVAGAPTACVDVDFAALLAAVAGGPADQITITGVRRYDLGAVAGVGLAVTDAVALGGGRVLVSAAAEDTPNAYDDGPVVGAALVLLDDDGVLATAALPAPDGAVPKVEGLAVSAATAGGLRLLAVVDADDPVIPSREIDLELSW